MLVPNKRVFQIPVNYGNDFKTYLFKYRKIIGSIVALVAGSQAEMPFLHLSKLLLSSAISRKMKIFLYENQITSGFYSNQISLSARAATASVVFYFTNEKFKYQAMQLL